jgi:hypothetical protein
MGLVEPPPVLKKKKKKKEKEKWVEPPFVHLCFNVLKQSIEIEEGRIYILFSFLPWIQIFVVGFAFVTCMHDRS